MNEYQQTQSKRSTEPNAPAPLTPPDGDGWELHSWQLDRGSGQFIVAVWVRDKAAANRRS